MDFIYSNRHIPSHQPWYNIEPMPMYRLTLFHIKRQKHFNPPCNVPIGMRGSVGVSVLCMLLAFISQIALFAIVECAITVRDFV